MKNTGIYLMVTMFATIVAAVYVEPTINGLVSGILLGAFSAVVVVALAP